MKAMVLHKPGAPLVLENVRTLEPGPGEIMVSVMACGVCRTDLHVVDGDLTEPTLPIIPGHEIVGVVEEVGEGVSGFKPGDRVGVPWLGYTCGSCSFCAANSENLCDEARFTGYQINGGYAEKTIADARFCFHLHEGLSDAHAPPLLCAGLIGYRSLKMAGNAQKLGIYGFGASSHIIALVAVHLGGEVYAYTRPGDEQAAQFARKLGAIWVGGSDEPGPETLHAAIIFAPVGSLVPASLRTVRKGGVVVCAGIHMSDIPSFPYHILWGERVVRSVANLTRADAVEFLELASKVPVQTHITEYPLSEANEALRTLRDGELTGAAVLIP
ncbi:MAG: zinc-dependent alcohol dehydrogenase family protein [Hyphomicrobiales bacterium]